MKGTGYLISEERAGNAIKDTSKNRNTDPSKHKQEDTVTQITP